MKVITYQIELLEPVLVTSLQGDPNSAVAFDYLPGSVLRGVWIGRYLGLHAGSALPRLFFDGSIRYLNGYPLSPYGPCLPVPASWRHIKHKEQEIVDFAVEAQESKLQWQSVSAPFYTQSEEDVYLLQPARHMMVHTQRTARFGRAMPYISTRNTGRPVLRSDEIAGTVYRYDALAAGQAFQAAIICDHDADASMLLDLMHSESRIALGGSRSGGYGQAEISQIREDNHDPEYQELEQSEDVSEDGLIVTLRSDLLLRNTQGQFVVDPDRVKEVLSAHLQVKLVLKDAFLVSKLIGGFNRKWCLPLPQALAVGMGSVLVFQNPGCAPEILKEVEARGLGERRAEGFGRLVFNRQRVEELVVLGNNIPVDRSPCIIREKIASDLAERMVTRLLRQHLDEGLLHAANSVVIDKPPANAQISRLRGAVLEALSHPPGTAGICHLLRSIEARSSIRRQFERCTVRRTPPLPLLAWLKEWLQYEKQSPWTMSDNHAEWKALLCLNDRKIDNLEIGGVKANIDDGLRLEYVLRLIDLVLAHAVKMRGKEK